MPVCAFARSRYMFVSSSSQRQLGCGVQGWGRVRGRVRRGWDNGAAGQKAGGWRRRGSPSQERAGGRGGTETGKANPGTLKRGSGLRSGDNGRCLEGASGRREPRSGRRTGPLRHAPVAALPSGAGGGPGRKLFTRCPAVRRGAGPRRLFSITLIKKKKKYSCYSCYSYSCSLQSSAVHRGAAAPRLRTSEGPLGDGNFGSERSGVTSAPARLPGLRRRSALAPSHSPNHCHD